MQLNHISKATMLFIIIALSFVSATYFEYEKQEDIFQEEKSKIITTLNKQNEEVNLIKSSIESLYVASDFVSKEELNSFAKNINENSQLEFELSNKPINNKISISIETKNSSPLYFNFNPRNIKGYTVCGNRYTKSTTCEKSALLELTPGKDFDFFTLNNTEFNFNYKMLFSKDYVITYSTIMLILLIMFNAQCKLNDKKNDLEIAKQNIVSKDNILATLSHEVKTPLNAIKFNTNKLSNSKEKTTILLSSHLLEGTIDNILSLQKKYRPKITNWNATQLGIDINLIYRELFLKKQINFFAKMEPATIRTDPDLARRVLFNLIDNAFKYTNNGSVTVLGYTVKDSFFIDIEDTGIGISNDKLQVIFKPYEQINSSKPGFGLGLSIVEEISKALNIKYEITSEQTKGTKFTLIFPLCSDNNLDKVCKAQYALAIDDDVFNREIYREIAIEHGLNMVIAKNSNEALSLFDEYLPKLILTDINLGEENMTGFDIAKIVKEKSKSNETKVYAVTANTIKYEDSEKGESEYIDGFIEKPFTAEQIIELCKKYCV